MNGRLDEEDRKRERGRRDKCSERPNVKTYPLSPENVRFRVVLSLALTPLPRV